MFVLLNLGREMFDEKSRFVIRVALFFYMQRHAAMDFIVCSRCDNEVIGNDIVVVMANFIFC